MDISGFRSEPHVAQRSRRDKLRVQQTSTPSSKPIEEFPYNLEQSSEHSGLNPNIFQAARHAASGENLLYHPSLFSSESINFSSDLNMFPDQKDRMANEGPRELQNDQSNNWRTLDSNRSSEWRVMNCASASNSLSCEINPNRIFIGEVTNPPSYALKPSYTTYQVSQSCFNTPCEISSHDHSQRHLGDQLHFTTPIYQNTIHDVVASASIETLGLEIVPPLVHQNIREICSSAWIGGGSSELALLPAYTNQSSGVLPFVDNNNNNNNSWTGHNENCHHSSGIARKNDEELRAFVSESNPQGLSLSLSSNPSKLPVVQFEEGSGSEDENHRNVIFRDPQDSHAVKSSYLYSIPKPSIISKSSGKSLQDVVGVSPNTCRNTGPLGPFTGYATILKTSKFLKPAQQLLDELCGVTRLKYVNTNELSERICGEVSTSDSPDAFKAIENEVIAKANNNSCASSSMFHGSNKISCDGGSRSVSSETSRPEYQQKKAKLLYMQEEVCRRYKQYQQQMQMGVSSFESVAGLSSVTPYISLALKTVSRHFWCLKNAISEQLRHIMKLLGEDLSSPTTRASSSNGDTNSSRLKYMDQSFQKHKSSGINMEFSDPQQHVWRPQRGLPERSVAILRAWLFEHFLHPYPTDTDKHMLATQTGLSRNQVSNWFINARVRVWKPMVEEIHMLETKGMAEPTQNHQAYNEIHSTTEGSSHPGCNNTQSKNPGHVNSIPNQQLQCFGNIEYSSPSTRDGKADEPWSQEKRSRLEFRVEQGIDGALSGFLPYQQSQVEVGGSLGAVSLTLGLRHRVENTQNQQSQEHDDDQLLRQYGGQMIRDFVG